jgi:hypothetical protein
MTVTACFDGLIGQTILVGGAGAGHYAATRQSGAKVTTVRRKAEQAGLTLASISRPKMSPPKDGFYRSAASTASSMSISRQYHTTLKLMGMN